MPCLSPVPFTITRLKRHGLKNIFPHWWAFRAAANSSRDCVKDFLAAAGSSPSSWHPSKPDAEEQTARILAVPSPFFCESGKPMVCRHRLPRLLREVPAFRFSKERDLSVAFPGVPRLSGSQDGHRPRCLPGRASACFPICSPATPTASTSCQVLQIRAAGAGFPGPANVLARLRSAHGPGMFGSDERTSGSTNHQAPPSPARRPKRHPQRSNSLVTEVVPSQAAGSEQDDPNQTPVPEPR